MKPFPHIVARIHALATDPTKTVSQVVEIVERDVAFATRLLRLVNAPTSALRQRCTSVKHAVSLLGLNRVASVATASAAAAFLAHISEGAPHIGAHAVAVGNVSRILARSANVSPDDAFTAGLLHDVGMLLILQLNEPLYEELLEQVGPGIEPTISEERMLLGFDHASFGGHVLRRWSLPEPLPEVASLHHDLPAAIERGGQVAAFVAILNIAEKLVPRLQAHVEPDESDLDAIANDAAMAHLGIPPGNLLKSWGALRDACRDSSEEPAPLSVDEFADPVVKPGPKSEQPRPGLKMSLPPIADVLEPPTMYPSVPERRFNGAHVMLLVSLVIGLCVAVAIAMRAHS